MTARPKKSLRFRLGRILTSPFRKARRSFQSGRDQPLGTKQNRETASISPPPFQPSDWDGDFPAIPPDPATRTVFVYMPFMAVGGAEHLALHVMKSLPEVRWIVITTVPAPSILGSTTELFKAITPYVYDAGQCLAKIKHHSFISYLINHFHPQVFYISNGSPEVYKFLPELRNRHPTLKIANQVYDHREGWIKKYTATRSQLIDLSIGANPHICRAYLEGGAPLKTVRLIEHCIDTTEFNPENYSRSQIQQLKNRLELPSERKIVAFVGRLHSQKRPMDFIELARRFQKCSDVFFLMVGDGPLSSTIDQQIEKLELGNIAKLPFYKPASDIFMVIDVLVLPSKFEGMPLVIMEAQAMGKAVVATAAGNNREFLNYTEGGLIVEDVGDVEDVERKVRMALKNPVDRLEVRKRVVGRVDCKLVARQYFEAFFGEGDF